MSTPTRAELRDLDAWIAQHVMDDSKLVGLKKRGYWYRPKACGYTDRESEAGRFTIEEAKKREYPHDEPVTIHKFSVREYTTDPAAAFAVLEKCAEREAEANMDGVQIDKIGIGWLVPTNDVDADAETLPLAICRFARKIFEK